MEMPEMTMTMLESAARHMATGVMDPGELARLVEADTGRAPSRNTLDTFRSQFRRHGDGWVDVIRKQTSERTRRWSVENPEKHCEMSTRWRAGNPAKKLFSNCRGRATRRGLDFALTVEDIEAMLAPMVCSATGLPLTWGHDGDTSRNPWAPSIDRVDCSKGYVPGNVRVVCVLYNLARSDFRDEDLLKVAKAVAERAP